MALPFKLQWPFARTAVKENPVARQVSGVVLGINRVSFPKHMDAKRLVREGLNANVTVYSCIMLIASAKAGVPRLLMKKAGISKENRNRFKKQMSMRTAVKCWNRYKQTGDERLRKAVETAEVEDHPLLTLLERPNPLQGGVRFEAWRSAFKLLHGNSFVVSAGPSNQPPRELWILRPERTSVVPDPVDFVKGYEHDVQDGQKPQFFARQQVWHAMMFSADDDYRGMSPLQVAMRNVLTVNEATRWNYALLKNSARPPMVASVKDGLTDPQFDRLKAQIDENYSGADNAGRPILGENGLEFKPAGFSPAEMEWLAGLKHGQRQVCVIYRVAPELVGDSENKTYSNYGEARKALYVEVVLPELDEEYEDLNNWLTPQFGDKLLLQYDRDQIEALQEDQAALWTRVEQSTVLSVNEKRAAIGYDDLPDEDGGTTILVSAAMTPLENVIQSSEVSLETSRTALEQMQNPPAPEEKPEPAVA